MAGLIVLDIDGVLNSITTVARGDGLQGWLDPRNVAMLELLMTQAGHPALLVSSSWREHRSVAAVTDILRAGGVNGQVIGATPVLPGRPRHVEIEVWLAAQPVRPTRFVILDDEHEMGPLAPWHIRTSRLHGLTAEDVEAAAGVLRNGPAQLR